MKTNIFLNISFIIFNQSRWRFSIDFTLTAEKNLKFNFLFPLVRERTEIVFWGKLVELPLTIDLLYCSILSQR